MIGMNNDIIIIIIREIEKPIVIIPVCVSINVWISVSIGFSIVIDKHIIILASGIVMMCYVKS